ncbi:unnamed protein product [Polarella glacialis]|uniref:Major facilitator superfamily (MFS) profile domain-containing protein n=1 Tax=Polarella glacialis TaxID=89957 RepID=A0A813DAZ0_POLGL|nr:unnamed protein product [Polarella glacialis]
MAVLGGSVPLLWPSQRSGGNSSDCALPAAPKFSAYSTANEEAFQEAEDDEDNASGRPDQRLPSRRLLAFLGAVSALEGADAMLLPASFRALQLDLALTPLDLASMSLAQALMSSLAAPVWGILADRGVLPRRIILAFGALGWGVVTLLLAAASSRNSMLLLRAVNGSLLACLGPVCQGIVADVTAESKRGEVLGLLGFLTLVGSMLASLITTPISRQMVLGVQGWRVAFSGIGAASIFVAILIWAQMEEPEKKESWGEPLPVPEDVAAEGELDAATPSKSPKTPSFVRRTASFACGSVACGSRLGAFRLRDYLQTPTFMAPQLSLFCRDALEESHGTPGAEPREPGASLTPTALLTVAITPSETLKFYAPQLKLVAPVLLIGYVCHNLEGVKILARQVGLSDFNASLISALGQGNGEHLTSECWTLAVQQVQKLSLLGQFDLRSCRRPNRLCTRVMPLPGIFQTMDGRCSDFSDRGHSVRGTAPPHAERTQCFGQFLMFWVLPDCLSSWPVMQNGIAGIARSALVSVRVPNAFVRVSAAFAYALLTALMGLTASWCATGVNRPILQVEARNHQDWSLFGGVLASRCDAQAVQSPVTLRSARPGYEMSANASYLPAPLPVYHQFWACTCYGITGFMPVWCLEYAMVYSVGFLSERVFGYKLETGLDVGGSNASLANDLEQANNTRALGLALVWATSGPWLLCLILYTFLHWSYPKDRARVAALKAGGSWCTPHGTPKAQVVGERSEGQDVERAPLAHP